MSTIGLFHVELDEPKLSCGAPGEWLDAEERAQLANFSLARPRRRYLAAHAALRLILSRIRGQDPGSIEFRKNEWGRPETDGGPSFNLSHSGARGLVAVADAGAVGVDIECGDRRVSPHVFDAVSSDAERRERALRRIGPGDRLRLWVRKEAVLKAFGRGLAYSPQALTVGAHARDVGCWRDVALADGKDTHAFSLVDLSLPFRSFGALALGGCVGGRPRPDIRPLTI